MSTKRKVGTSEFLTTHPVFSLDEAARALAPPGGKAGTVERLKYHLEQGHLKLLARETYAVVPAKVPADRFQPDPFLVAITIRPDGVFSHHSALELLGAAHSVWRQCTLYAERRRNRLSLDGVTVRFFEHPKPMRSKRGRELGTRKVERRGRLLRVTGPERTLVEGFRRPDLAGGLEELTVCAGGFPTLDLDLLEKVLNRYQAKSLWAASGWFLERHGRTFHVPESYLNRLERRRPCSAQYLLRDQRGGALASRWNLILPHELVQRGEPDER
jgi:predicted transcriptional regulator of viral defense system